MRGYEISKQQGFYLCYDKISKEYCMKTTYDDLERYDYRTKFHYEEECADMVKFFNSNCKKEM